MEKKEFLKKKCLSMKRVMLLLVIVWYASPTIGSILKGCSGDLALNTLKK